MASFAQGGSADLPSAKDSTSSSKSAGFKSFWKRDKSDSAPSRGEGTSDGGRGDSTGKTTKKPSNHISRLLHRGSSNELKAQGDADGTSNPQKRRQQIYQAQKRHRDRRAEYVKNLENEVAKLRNMDSHAQHEKSSLEKQNRAMHELLASHSIDARLGSMNLAAAAASSSSLPSSQDAHMFDLATVDIRFDPKVNHERTFLDHSSSDDLGWSSATTLSTPRVEPQAAVKGDSWAAVDFILALEWPCRDHLVHPVANPGAVPDTEDDSEKFTCHSLMTTVAVYEAAFSPQAHVHTHKKGSTLHNGAEPQSQDKWLLPHSEIEKLVDLSEKLPLDDEYITPAQAYSAIRQNVATNEELKPVMELLKIPLGVVSECRGYGAVLPQDQFWEHLETAITCLRA